MTDRIWTIKDIIDWSQGFLHQHGSDTPRLDAELLLCKALGCRRLDLYLDHHKPLIPVERDAYRTLIKRRAAGEPVAYILEQKDFYGLSFKVDRHTLIPRPDTETLVEKVLEFIPKDAAWRGLDIGTGSGCIAISIKKNRESCGMEAWDISEGALSCARDNARALGADIAFRRCDSLSPASWSQLEGGLDFIVSNPPYIAYDERPSLSPSVARFEPEGALFAGDGGLSFYRHFARQAPLHLREGGKIFLEVGYQQAHAVSSILEDCAWTDLAIYRDLGGHERVVSACRPERCPVLQ